MRVHLGYLTGMALVAVTAFRLGTRYGSGRALWARIRRRLGRGRDSFH